LEEINIPLLLTGRINPVDIIVCPRDRFEQISWNSICYIFSPLFPKMIAIHVHLFPKGMSVK
jgi:hypothetical protein